MEVVVGPNPPRRCSDTTMGMGGNAWHVLLESPSCLLSQTEWGGTLCGQHPPWQLPEERPLWKWDSNPTCVSQWERGALCHCCLRMGQEAVATPGPPAELLTTANAQTFQLTACLCSAGHYLVGEPELQTSFICQQLAEHEEEAHELLLAAVPPAASLQPSVPWGAACPAQGCSLLRTSYI